MKTLYKSEKGKKEIINLYDQKLKDLEIEYSYRSIATAFGETNVIVAGNYNKPPIVLVHGSNGCAPIALETYPNLYNDFHVFAVDVLAQPNKSAENVLSMKGNDYGVWLNEVIEKLQLENVTLAGFSFGGLIILKTLIENEDNIKEVFLSAPAFIVNGNPLVALVKVFIPMKMYMRTKKQKYVEKFLRVLFSDRDEFALQFLSIVFLNFNMDFTPIPEIKKQEANKITTPITLIAAKDDMFFPGEKMINRAKKIFPSLKKTVLLEGSKHVQSAKDNQLIQNLILKE